MIGRLLTFLISNMFLKISNATVRARVHCRVEDDRLIKPVAFGVMHKTKRKDLGPVGNRLVIWSIDVIIHSLTGDEYRIVWR